MTVIIHKIPDINLAYILIFISETKNILTRQERFYKIAFKKWERFCILES